MTMGRDIRIGCISSFVPKKCGIATFSRDLLNGIKNNEKDVSFFIAAAEHANETYNYTKDVVAVLKSDDKKTYLEASARLNALDLDVILLQHEFGLFGGKFTSYIKDDVLSRFPTGDLIFSVLNNLKRPIITTLHTVIANPDPERKAVINRIGAVSTSVVTMTQSSKAMLRDEYTVPEAKITVIPHGTPQIVNQSKDSVLDELGLSKNHFYLVMSGLLGPNKGIDLVIKALPNILKKNPEVRLIVIGQTHPNILAVQGNSFIDSLIQLAKTLKVEYAVTFINQYVSTPELSMYLLIADIYLTPHRDPEQAASGTLAYAIGNGLIAVSTPYRYAREMLSNKRGFLVPFENYAAIAKTVNQLIANESLRKSTKKLIKPYANSMSWPAVGEAYLKIIHANI
jgi:glycosyltransferase involved in cell wall biosynthesis